MEMLSEARYFKRVSEKDRDRERYQNPRLSGNRLTSVLGQDGENIPAPLWRGDHTFSTDAAKYSLAHFIEPDVAREHPNWTKEQVRATAVSRFEKRLAQDLQYEHKETAHAETVVNWHIIETTPGSKELATEYGGKQVTLRELWAHTKEYATFVGNPAAYNNAEEQAQMAMQDMFVSGNANAFVSVLSHPDSIRYVQVWERREDAIESKQVDLFASTGRDFSHEEGKSLIKHLQKLAQEKHQGDVVAEDTPYVHFFVKNGGMNESDVRTIARMQSIHSVFIDRVPVPKQQLWVPLVEQIAFDTKDAMAVLGTYLKDRIDQTMQAFIEEHDLSTPHTVLVIRNERETKTQKIDRAFLPSFRKPMIDVVGKDKERGRDTMRAMFAEWFISKKTLEYSALIPEGSAAALFWLRFLAAPKRPEMVAQQPVIVRGEKENASKVLLHPSEKKDKKRSLWKRFNNHVMRFFEQPLQKEKHSTARRAERLVKKYHKERVKLLTRSEQFTISTWRKLWLIASSFSGERKKGRKPGIPPNETRTRDGRSKQRSGESMSGKSEKRFQFALIVWQFFIASRTPEPTSPVKDAAKHERRHQERETPWVLLAIIWYLTMIREQGLRRSISPKANRKRRRGPRQHLAYPVGRTLPVRGVIYPPFMIE